MWCLAADPSHRDVGPDRAEVDLIRRHVHDVVDPACRRRLACVENPNRRDAHRDHAAVVRRSCYARPDLACRDHQCPDGILQNVTLADRRDRYRAHVVRV